MEDMYSKEFLESLDISFAFNLSDFLIDGALQDNLSMGDNETMAANDEQQYEKALLNYYLMGIAGTTVCFTGIFCNILSVIVLTRRSMNSSTYSYLAALAICDTLALFLTVIIFLLSEDTKMPQKGKFIWHRTSYALLFPFLHPAAVMFQVTSIWLTLAFTVDRYIMICHPFKAERLCSVGRARKVIIVVYILGALFNIPRYLEYTSQDIQVPTMTGGSETRKAVQYTEMGRNQVFIDLVHSYLYLTFVCGLPFLILAILNIFLIYAVHLSKKKGRLINAKEKRRNDTTIMLIGVILIFLLCQGPALISRMVYAIDFNLATKSMTFHKINEGGNFLIIVNSAINIVPYYFFGKRFRKEFWRLFCKCFLSNQELQKMSRNLSFSVDRRRLSQGSVASQFELNGFHKNGEYIPYQRKQHRDSNSPLLNHSTEPNNSESVHNILDCDKHSLCSDKFQQESPPQLKVIWEMDDNKNEKCNVKIALNGHYIESQKL